MAEIVLCVHVPGDDGVSSLALIDAEFLTNFMQGMTRHDETATTWEITVDGKPWAQGGRSTRSLS